MATTTNYSWTTPNDTDLVKDGAAAIRTLGSSIDTTTKNLNPQTTTGAIAYRSATSNVNTSLPLGTAGQVLTVNSGETAPEWATPPTGGMTLLSTTTLSGASGSVTGISGAYTDLRIYIVAATTSTDQNYISLRLNNDSTANRHAIRSYSATNVGNLSFDSTSIEIAGPADTTTSQTLIRVDIPLYARTDVWKWADVSVAGTDGADTSKYYYIRRMGIYNQTTAISSIGWVTTAGNAGGTMFIYGVK